MERETLLEVLHEYVDSHRKPAWLEEKLVAHWRDPDWDVPLCGALHLFLFDYNDNLRSKDFIDGAVEGALAMVAPKVYTELDPLTYQPIKIISTGVEKGETIEWRS